MIFSARIIADKRLAEALFGYYDRDPLVLAILRGALLSAEIRAVVKRVVDVMY